MKKLCMLLIVFALVISVVPAVAEQPLNERLSIEINGESVTIPENYGAVQIVDDRTMVPVRFVSEHLGFRVEWIASMEMVMFIHPRNLAQNIGLMIGQYRLYCTMNGALDMDVPAMIIDNRTYIPIRFFAEIIGFEIDWDEDTRTVILNGEV